MKETTKSIDGNAENAARFAIISLVLLGILFIAVNILAAGSMHSKRLDLTQDNLYTLSPSTKSLINELDEQITFKLYVSSGLSQQVPHLGVYANRVRDLLAEYESISGGKIKLELLDPIPFSNIEDRAVASGLRGIPAVSGGDNMYFGLVGTNTTDDIEKIPFIQIDREAFLEYDISRMLFALAKTKPTVVGILSTLPTDGTVKFTATGQQEAVPPYVVRDQIGSLFETRFLGKELDGVPEDINVLLIVHPKNTSEKTLFSIDQYLLAGGKAIIFVDPFAETEAMQGQMMRPSIEGSSLAKLFDTWGLKYDPAKVVVDRLSARKVLPEAGNRLIEYLPWLELRGPSLDRRSPITSSIEVVAVASAGHISTSKDAPIKISPLIVSSPGSNLISAKKVQGFRNPKKLLREFTPGDGQYTIAARVNGTVQSSFPEGLTETKNDHAGDGKKDTKPIRSPNKALKKSSQPLDVIVVADADILADRFWVIKRDFAGQKVPVATANNGDFVLNAIESLSGGNNLMALRGRGTASRPFEVLRNIQQIASQKFEDKERQLGQTLLNTEKKLKELRRKNPEGSEAVVSKNDQRSMEKMQREILKLRSELRKVRRSLTNEYESLEMRLWFFNIAMVPLALTAFLIILAIARSIRRKRHAYKF